MRFFTLLNAVEAIRISDSPSQAAAPGAGQVPISPDDKGAQVRKDGFFPVKCVHEGTHLNLDNQSSKGQKSYSGQNINVSVVWYHETVPKIDLEEMTPRKCFNFCRVQNRIGFFGLIHGRDCYCTPYYHQTEGGEGEDCDLPCPGDQTQFCGGKNKSNIYSMHFCDNSAKDVQDATDAAGQVNSRILELVSSNEQCQVSLQGRGGDFQAKANSVGAKFASDYFQSAKVRAGELRRLLEAGEALSKEFDELVKGPAPESTAVQKEEYVEAQVLNLHEFKSRALDWFKQAEPEFKKSCEKLFEPGYEIANEYRNIAYFAKQQGIEGDFEFTGCGGEIVGAPKNMDEISCAIACRDNIECEGFSVFGIAGHQKPSEKKTLDKTVLIQRAQKRFLAAAGKKTKSGSCSGKCGQVGEQGGCACDFECQAFDDCCDDFGNTCVDKSGVCVLLSSVNTANLYSAKECENHEACNALTECYWRLSDAKGLKVKYDVETQWCKA